MPDGAGDFGGEVPVGLRGQLARALRNFLGELLETVVEDDVLDLLVDLCAGSWRSPWLSLLCLDRLGTQLLLVGGDLPRALDEFLVALVAQRAVHPLDLGEQLPGLQMLLVAGLVRVVLVSGRRWSPRSVPRSCGGEAGRGSGIARPAPRPWCGPRADKCSSSTGPGERPSCRSSRPSSSAPGIPSARDCSARWNP